MLQTKTDIVDQSGERADLDALPDCFAQNRAHPGVDGLQPVGNLLLDVEPGGQIMDARRKYGAYGSERLQGVFCDLPALRVGIRYVEESLEHIDPWKAVVIGSGQSHGRVAGPGKVIGILFRLAARDIADNLLDGVIRTADFFKKRATHAVGARAFKVCHAISYQGLPCDKLREQRAEFNYCVSILIDCDKPMV